MDIPTELTTETSVQFLNSIANNLPSTSPSLNILKSYYYTKCRIVTLGGIFDLPQRFTKTTIRCPKCCVQYEDGEATYRIKPEQKMSRFARKLLKRHENEKNMTRYQERYLKQLIHKGDTVKHNTLIIKCGVCKNKVKEKLKKPIQSSMDCTVQEEIPVSSRKKKKKKDRFSGLNKDAILSATSTPNKSYNTSNFVPLEVTPNIKDRHENAKRTNIKKLLTQNQDVNKLKKSKDKKIQKKNKERKLKGLQNLLNNSKQKSSPSAALKKFLTNI